MSLVCLIMFENVKVSIIIPVYNTQKYIKKCLDSVINQTYRNIEIICINDGSTDDSINILKEYKENEPRIILIDKKNEGVSTARNVGLDIATGSYIMFVDSDDYVEPQFVEKPLKKITETNTDICVFGHYEEKKENTIKDIQKNILLTNLSEKYEYSIKDLKGFQYFVWDKIWDASFIKNYNIKFFSSKSAEDIAFNLGCCFKKPNYSFLPECLYHYTTDRNNSAVQDRLKLLSTDLEAYSYLLKSDDYKNADNTYKELILKILLDSSLWNIDHISILQYFQKRKIINNLIDFINLNFDKQIINKNEQRFNELKRNTSFRPMNFIKTVAHKIIS